MHTQKQSEIPLYPKVCSTGNLSFSHQLKSVNLPVSIKSPTVQSNSPMVRSIRGPYDGRNMWLEETLAIAKLCHAQCIIYNGTPGCRNTWGMVKPFSRDLESQGYPVHIMNDDAFDDRVESWDATRERLDEFFQVRGLL